jgi:uncharacterized membrane protein YozB (DUF420 family)/cytochrome oxidase Cu insertion factor (SCO1/SenC/PrrC family)
MSRLVGLILLILVPLPLRAQDEIKEPAPDAKLFKPYDMLIRDFTLEDAAGTPVSPRDLLGKIWVAQFFYPGCNLCSRNTPTMQRLQEIYRGKPDVRLVSIDLINTKPETLEEFARDHGAEPGQWLFLTGPEAKVHDIVRVNFFNMVFRKKDATAGDEIGHSTKLILVGPDGHSVGYVEGTDPKAADALKTEIDGLRSRRRLDERIPVTGADLPRFNATLNASCTVLLLLGWIAIRAGWVTLHKLLMLSALAVSAVFLASYLFYHFVVMEMEPTRFQGTGPMRYVYFGVLLTHTILAVVVAPLALYITVQGLRNALPAHVKIARWTLPIWLYVSVTGVAVYWMLYQAPG